MRQLKKKLALLCTLLITASILGGFTLSKSASNTNPSQFQQLSIELGSKPANLDPAYYGGALTSGAEGGHIINNIFEGLMREVDRKLVPAIATKYTVSTDGLVYTFTLRKANWSDGKPVRAQDFEYAWKRALDPNYAFDYSYLLYCLKGGEAYNSGEGRAEDVGVKALNDKTLQVTLTSPMSYFPYMTTLHNFMPVRKDIIEKSPSKWSMSPVTAVCDGPFKLANYYTEGNNIILIKNMEYWNSTSTKLDKITAQIMEDSSDATKAYEDNKIDLVDTISFEDVPTLSQKFSTFKILPEHMTYFYVFNTTKAPMDNVLVRKALALSIDRTTLTKTTIKPGQIPAGGLVPCGFMDSKGNEFRKTAGEYDLVNSKDQIDKAKELLAKAGYPDGKGFPTIKITYNTKPEHDSIAKAIQQMWKQNLGINVELQADSSKDFNTALNQGDFMVARSGWGADYPDAMTFLNLFTSTSEYNSSNWKNDEYDKLIEAANLSYGENRDKQLYKAENLLMDNMVIMPIYYLTDPVMIKDNVKNWNKTIVSYWWFGNTYLSK